MGKIYVPEHFREVSGQDIVSKLNSNKLYVPLGMDKNHYLVPTSMPILFYNATINFPSGKHLWDGRNVVIGENSIYLAQAENKKNEYDRFNKDTITKELTEIVSQAPSIVVHRENKFLVTYDKLTEKEERKIRFGYIERTRIVILPNMFLAN